MNARLTLLYFMKQQGSTTVTLVSRGVCTEVSIDAVIASIEREELK